MLTILLAILLSVGPLIFYLAIAVFSSRFTGSDDSAPSNIGGEKMRNRPICTSPGCVRCNRNTQVRMNNLTSPPSNESDIAALAYAGTLPPKGSSGYPSLYEVYHDAGFMWPFFLSALPMWLVASLGVYYNSVLVYTTLKRRTLRNWCNILIALDCAYCAVSELGVSGSYGVIVTGYNWIPFGICYWLLALPNVCYALSYCGLLSIALERILSVLFLFDDEEPMKKFYIRLILFVHVVVAVFYLVNGFLNYLANSQVITDCQIGGDLFVTGTYQVFVKVSMAVVGLTALCYICIGLIMHVKRKNIGQNEHDSIKYNRRVYRSLLMILCIVVAVHVASNIWRFVKLQPPNIGLLESYFQECLFYALTYFANTANAPVLYLMSKDYNTAFKSLWLNPFAVFDWLLSVSKKFWAHSGSTVQHMNSTVVNVNSLRQQQQRQQWQQGQGQHSLCNMQTTHQQSGIVRSSRAIGQNR